MRGSTPRACPPSRCPPRSTSDPVLTSVADAVAGRTGDRPPAPRATKRAAVQKAPDDALTGEAQGSAPPARQRARPERRRQRRPEAAPPPDEAVDGPPGDPENAARVICLRMLDRRARSRAELAEALARKGIPDDSAGKVLDRLTEVGLIDDAALADAMAGAQHRERGLARKAVALKLRRRGFTDEVVEAAVGTIDAGDERSRARDLVTRRQRTLAALPPEVQTRRLVGLLARKGYSPGTAYEVVREVLAHAAAPVELDAGFDADLT